jgi:selenocysteine-specific elongation factor
MNRAEAPDHVRVWVQSEIFMRGFALIPGLLGKSRFSDNDISEALKDLQRGNEIVIHDKIAAIPDKWRALRDHATRLIDSALSKNPERPGYDLSDLRAGLRDKGMDVFEALLADLCSSDFVRKESTIARRSHRPALPVNLQPLAESIVEHLSTKPFDPPPRKEFKAGSVEQRVVKFLIASGKIIEISSDVLLLPENFVQMRSATRDFILQNGPATVSELRQALGSSRRVMVPFLEKLDREGFTRRMGDRRVLAAGGKP